MWEGPNLFRALDDEWRDTGTNAAARSALRRWADADQTLAAVPDPATLVSRCHDRDNRDRGGLLVAVIRHARTDRLAARTVLQAVLPGLAAVSRRARGFVGPGRVWRRVDELDQHVVAVACERIHALAPAPPPWLAKALVDGTWQRVRWYAVRQMADGRRRRALAEADDPVAERDRLAEEYTDERLKAAVAVAEGHVDELVEPLETRERLCWALRVMDGDHRHGWGRGNVPL